MHFEKMRREVDVKEEETLQLLRDFAAEQTEILDGNSDTITQELDDINEKQAGLDQLIRLSNSDLLNKQSHIIETCDAIDEEPEFELGE